MSLEKKIRLIRSASPIKAFSMFMESYALYLSQPLEEALAKDLVPPKWVAGYEPLWYASAAEMFLNNAVMTKEGGRNYGDTTRLFKEYVSVLFGVSIDEIKAAYAEAHKDGKKKDMNLKAGSVLSGHKKDTAVAMGKGDSDAAKAQNKKQKLNQALNKILSANLDDESLAKALRDKITIANNLGQIKPVIKH